MKDKNLEQTIRQIFATILQLSPQSISPDLSPDSCESWDSLNHIHLVNAINETLEIDLTVEQQLEMLNFDLVLEVVAEALEGKKG